MEMLPQTFAEIQWLEEILTYLSYIAVSAAVSWYFYFFRRYELIGGYIGGVIIAFLGSVIFSRLLDNVFQMVIGWLMNPSYGSLKIKVNLIATATGAILMIYILIKINHDRIRRDY